MHRRPRLEVDLLLSMETMRANAEQPTAFDLERRLVARLGELWTRGVRLPRLLVFAAESDRNGNGRARGVMHAKFAVCDSRWVLVTSANLTRSAFEENLEIGVVVDDRQLAGRLESALASWVAIGTIRVFRPGNQPP